MLQKLSFDKGMICLRFSRYFKVLNGYETYGIPYPFVLAFQRAIMSRKRLRDDQDTPFPRWVY